MVGKRVLAWWAALLALVSLGPFALRACSCDGGMNIPTNHPTIRLLSARVSPAGTINAGQKLVVRAITNKTSKYCVMEYCATIFGSNDTSKPIMSQRWSLNAGFSIPLHDDGRNGDAVAHDGNWYGEQVLTDIDNRDFDFPAFMRLSFKHQRDKPWYSIQTIPLSDFKFRNPQQSGQLPPGPSQQ